VENGVTDTNAQLSLRLDTIGSTRWLRKA